MPPTRQPSKKFDPDKFDRPWKQMAKRVRHLPHYNLPRPYQRAKLYYPGDGRGTRATESARLPSMHKRVQTVIMPPGSGHHPKGPSMLEGWSPKHGGCPHYEPHGGTNAMAEIGTLKHEVAAHGNFERLGGIKESEEEVRWVREQTEILYKTGFVDKKFGGRGSRIFDGEEYIEKTFGIEGLNFGTIDRLRYSSDGTRAIVIDFKFGSWPVRLPFAKGIGGGNNLQLLNYAVYAFFLRYPLPASVTVVLLHAKTRAIYTHTYFRRSCYLLKAKIAKVIDWADHAKADPASVPFFPSPSNCSWCTRINCPARLDLAASVMSLWKHEPVVLPRPDLLTISTEQLGLLKSFVNPLQRCIDSINEEVRRRAIDENDMVPGYELRQRSGQRRIVGLTNISAACNLVMAEWPKWFPNVELDLSKIAVDRIEIGVDDIEQAAQKAAPYGKILRAKELVAQLLNTPALVQSNTVFYVAQKIPTTKE